MKKRGKKNYGSSGVLTRNQSKEISRQELPPTSGMEGDSVMRMNSVSTAGSNTETEQGNPDISGGGSNRGIVVQVGVGNGQQPVGEVVTQGSAFVSFSNSGDHSAKNMFHNTQDVTGRPFPTGNGGNSRRESSTRLPLYNPEGRLHGEVLYQDDTVRFVEDLRQQIGPWVGAGAYGDLGENIPSVNNISNTERLSVQAEKYAKQSVAYSLNFLGSKSQPSSSTRQSVGTSGETVKTSPDPSMVELFREMKNSLDASIQQLTNKFEARLNLNDQAIKKLQAGESQISDLSPQVNLREGSFTNRVPKESEKKAGTAPDNPSIKEREVMNNQTGTGGKTSAKETVGRGIPGENALIPISVACGILYTLDEFGRIVFDPEDEKYGPRPLYDEVRNGIVFQLVRGYNNPPPDSYYYVPPEKIEQITIDFETVVLSFLVQEFLPGWPIWSDQDREGESHERVFVCVQEQISKNSKIQNLHAKYCDRRINHYKKTV
jgi:hypothetical protein